MKNIILISAAIVTIIGGGISVYMMGKSSSILMNLHRMQWK